MLFKLDAVQYYELLMADCSSIDIWKRETLKSPRAAELRINSLAG